MKQLKFYIFALSLSLLSCGNNMRKKEPVINDEQPVIVQSDTDTLATSVLEQVPKAEKESPVPTVSSSHSYKSSSNDDNMRGFDPASEDDMDDNGMSRYMENNDEEGWD